MGAYLSTPVREKISDDKSTDKLIYGVSSMQGWRISQEDAHNCSPEFDCDLDTSFFAIYDGHGGAEVAQYASKNLPDFLKKMSTYKEDLGQALEEAFLKFDETIIHDDVLKELKEMAGVESDGEPEQDEEEEKEAAMLFEEADMPLEKLLERYTSAGSGRQLNKLRQNAKLQSPAIRAKKESSSDESDARTNNGDVKLKLEKELLVNGKKEKDSELTSADSGIVVDNQGSSTDMSEAKSVQKSDAVTAKGDDTAVDCNSTSNNGCSQSGQSSGDVPAGLSSSPSAVSSTTSADGPAGGSSSKTPDCSDPEPGSSLGKKRSKRKGVIPAEGEDESSCSEDSTDEAEWRSSEDEAGEGEGEGEPDSEDDEDDEEDEDDDDDEDECAMMGGTGEPGFDSGCTAVVAVLRGKQLYVANAGDSRCVVCRDGNAVDMSIDHKPEDEPEQSRINNAGGKVTFDGRVNGGLNLSRALGDHCYKKNEDLGPREQMITALPDIKKITLDDKDEFMVLACDGIWNVMSSQDVVNTVRERLKSDVTKLSSICEELFEMCLAPDTTGDGTGCDNMTCMIINFSKLHGNAATEKATTGKRSCDEPSATDDAGQPDVKKAKTSDDSVVPESSS